MDDHFVSQTKVVEHDDQHAMTNQVFNREAADVACLTGHYYFHMTLSSLCDSTLGPPQVVLTKSQSYMGKVTA